VRPKQATPDSSAIDVLFNLNRVHKCTGQAGEVHGDIGGGVGSECVRNARPERDEEEVLFACLPAQLVSRMGGHAIQKECGVIVCGHTAIHESERVLPDLDKFGREVDGCCRAGTDQLPERNLQIAVIAILVIVTGIRVGGNGPRRIGGDIPRDHEKEAIQIFRKEICISPKDYLQLLS